MGNHVCGSGGQEPERPPLVGQRRTQSTPRGFDQLPPLGPASAPTSARQRSDDAVARAQLQQQEALARESIRAEVIAAAGSIRGVEAADRLLVPAPDWRAHLAALLGGLGHPHGDEDLALYRGREEDEFRSRLARAGLTLDTAWCAPIVAARPVPAAEPAVARRASSRTLAGRVSCFDRRPRQQRDEVAPADDIATPPLVAGDRIESPALTNDSRFSVSADTESQFRHTESRVALSGLSPDEFTRSQGSTRRQFGLSPADEHDPPSADRGRSLCSPLMHRIMSTGSLCGSAAPPALGHFSRPPDTAQRSAFRRGVVLEDLCSPAAPVRSKAGDAAPTSDDEITLSPGHGAEHVMRSPQHAYGNMEEVTVSPSERLSTHHATAAADQDGDVSGSVQHSPRAMMQSITVLSDDSRGLLESKATFVEIHHPAVDDIDGGWRGDGHARVLVAEDGRQRAVAALSGTGVWAVTDAGDGGVYIIDPTSGRALCVRVDGEDRRDSNSHFVTMSSALSSACVWEVSGQCFVHHGADGVSRFLSVNHNFEDRDSVDGKGGDMWAIAHAWRNDSSIWVTKPADRPSFKLRFPEPARVSTPDSIPGEVAPGRVSPLCCPSQTEGSRTENTVGPTEQSPRESSQPVPTTARSRGGRTLSPREPSSARAPQFSGRLQGSPLLAEPFMWSQREVTGSTSVVRPVPQRVASMASPDSAEPPLSPSPALPRSESNSPAAGRLRRHFAWARGDGDKDESVSVTNLDGIEAGRDPEELSVNALSATQFDAERDLRTPSRSPGRDGSPVVERPHQGFAPTPPRVVEPQTPPKSFSRTDTLKRKSKAPSRSTQSQRQTAPGSVGRQTAPSSGRRASPLSKSAAAAVVARLSAPAQPKQAARTSAPAQPARSRSPNRGFREAAGTPARRASLATRGGSVAGVRAPSSGARVRRRSAAA
eukprot:TRINITY_DN9647_c0_g1_i3.p1 TRINITY_DN9647_c0_g1~~TRINITY_DN9647_c0_g1_i3.p1  ORF type:complete len:937 (+),score=245.13 TRINITY_DN9647_c0_g1_i3:218-3028(+)